MKSLLPLLPVLVLIAARPVHTPAPLHDHGVLAGAQATDDPPGPDPIDCPVCAGNGELHRRIMMFVADRGLLHFALGWTRC